MISKEFRKLNRREMVDIIYQLKKNEQQLLERIDALETALAEKQSRLSEEGAIMDAVTAITQAMSVAQTTTEQYLRQIEKLKEETEKECARKLEAANESAAQIRTQEKLEFIPGKKNTFWNTLKARNK